MTCGGGEEFFVCEADQFTNGLMVECIFALDFALVSSSSRKTPRVFCIEILLDRIRISKCG